jgi:hypothetical protein
MQTSSTREAKARRLAQGVLRSAAASASSTRATRRTKLKHDHHEKKGHRRDDGADP